MKLEPPKTFTVTLSSTAICLGMFAAYSSGVFSLEVVECNAEDCGRMFRELLTNKHLMGVFLLSVFHVHLGVLNSERFFHY